ncbi:SMP-30/gluconolactonase/LRE family protein [Thiococcus pfennigii]|uniref:SMP-30/gluconolactonase/LRE family protein n=1 Tax=Thiococcus pfennigii TaxID=1057 RepID=UPI001903E213|nr:SMP-30/gluconolactonase/LRE family protein [Thiococcus pfennigii]MBK1699550.1 hypothetical protein [Thiococcus pfennigii]
MSDPNTAWVAIIMGVPGSGRSTVGRLLAAELGWAFVEGDDCQPPENRAKLERGESLDEEARRPWIEALRARIAAHLSAGTPAVVACAALSPVQRERLRVDPQRVRLILLQEEMAMIAGRLRTRRDQPATSGAPDGGFAALAQDMPDDALVVDVGATPDAIVRIVRRWLFAGTAGEAGADRPPVGKIAGPDTDIRLDGLIFPETPRWHEGRLWLTDRYAQRVLTLSPRDIVETILEMDDRPGGLGWLPDGTLLVIAIETRRIYRLVAGRLELHADLSDMLGWPCNDMLVDQAGRAYVGNYGYDVEGGAPLVSTKLVRVDPNGRATTVGGPVIFPNGTALTADGRTMLVAETFANRLSAFRVSAEGGLEGHRTWAEVGPATPDGICLDSEGAVWAASPRTHEVLRILEGGEIAARLRPHGIPYACVLGGTDRRTLFICTAETSEPEAAMRSPSGRIETIRVAVPGAGQP